MLTAEELKNILDAFSDGKINEADVLDVIMKGGLSSIEHLKFDIDIYYNACKDIIIAAIESNNPLIKEHAYKRYQNGEFLNSIHERIIGHIKSLLKLENT